MPLSVTTAFSNLGNLNATFTISATTAVGRTQYVIITKYASDASVSSVTGTGATWTKHDSGLAARGVEVWVGIGATANGDITVTRSGALDSWYVSADVPQSTVVFAQVEQGTTIPPLSCTVGADEVGVVIAWDDDKGVQFSGSIPAGWANIGKHWDSKSWGRFKAPTSSETVTQQAVSTAGTAPLSGVVLVLGGSVLPETTADLPVSVGLSVATEAVTTTPTTTATFPVAVGLTADATAVHAAAVSVPVSVGVTTSAAQGDETTASIGVSVEITTQVSVVLTTSSTIPVGVALTSALQLVQITSAEIPVSVSLTAAATEGDVADAMIPVGVALSVSIAPVLVAAVQFPVGVGVTALAQGPLLILNTHVVVAAVHYFVTVAPAETMHVTVTPAEMMHVVPLAYDASHVTLVAQG